MEQMLQLGGFARLAVRPDTSPLTSLSSDSAGRSDDEGHEDESSVDCWTIGCEVCGVWLVDENDHAQQMQCTLCGCWQHIRCWKRYLRKKHRFVPDFRTKKFCCWSCEPAAWGTLPAPPHTTEIHQKSRLAAEIKAPKPRASLRHQHRRNGLEDHDASVREDSALELGERDQDEEAERPPSADKAKRTVIKVNRRSRTFDQAVAPPASSSGLGLMTGTRSAGGQASSLSEFVLGARKDPGPDVYSEEDELEDDDEEKDKDQVPDSESDDGWRDICEVCGSGPTAGLEPVTCSSCGSAQHARCWNDFLWRNGLDPPSWQDTVFWCCFCKPQLLDSFNYWPPFSAKLTNARIWGPRTMPRPLLSRAYPSSAEGSSGPLSRAEETSRNRGRSDSGLWAVARPVPRGQGAVTDVGAVTVPRAMAGATRGTDDHRAHLGVSCVASDWSNTGDAQMNGAVARDVDVRDVRPPGAHRAAPRLNHDDHQRGDMIAIDVEADPRRFDRAPESHRALRSPQSHSDFDGTFVPSASVRSGTAGTNTQEETIATSSSEAVSSEETIVATRKKRRSKRRRFTRSEWSELQGELHDLDVEAGEAAWFALGAPAPTERSLPKAFSVLAGLKRAAAWTPAAETFYSDTLKTANRATWRRIRALAKARKHAKRQVRERHAEGALRAMLASACACCNSSN